MAAVIKTAETTVTGLRRWRTRTAVAIVILTTHGSQKSTGCGGARVMAVATVTYNKPLLLGTGGLMSTFLGVQPLVPRVSGEGCAGEYDFKLNTVIRRETNRTVDIYKILTVCITVRLCLCRMFWPVYLLFGDH